MEEIECRDKISIDGTNIIECFFLIKAYYFQSKRNSLSQLQNPTTTHGRIDTSTQKKSNEFAFIFLTKKQQLSFLD